MPIARRQILRALAEVASDDCVVQAARGERSCPRGDAEQAGRRGAKVVVYALPGGWRCWSGGVRPTTTA